MVWTLWLARKREDGAREQGHKKEVQDAKDMWINSKASLPFASRLSRTGTEQGNFNTTETHFVTQKDLEYKRIYITGSCGVERRTVIVAERFGLFSNETCHLKKGGKTARAHRPGTQTPKKSMKMLANGILSLDAGDMEVEKIGKKARDYPSGDENISQLVNFRKDERCSLLYHLRLSGNGKCF